MTLPLIEKYRAKSFNDIRGQEIAVQEIRTFFKLFPKKKALILNGPVGTGKTSMACALADEFNCELFELNASDLRNRASLEEVLKPSIEQKSLFKKGKIILMDEADGITASDRGGLPELIALISKTNFPIIITANDIWQKKFSLLRQRCQIINLKELNSIIVFEILKEVTQREKKDTKIEVLNLIARKTKGDVRAALNDLQSVFDVGEDGFLSEISEREKQESIFEALKILFQSEPDSDIIKVFDSTYMDLNDILLWVEENIPSEYHGQALFRAYDSLSKADIFKGRIYRQQHWRFLVYQNFFLSAGISSSTRLKNKRFISYKRPSRILKIWMSNQRIVKEKEILTKYARLCHMSKKKAQKEKFLVPFILEKTDEKTRQKLDLNESEEDYLKERRAAIVVSAGLNRFRG